MTEELILSVALAAAVAWAIGWPALALTNWLTLRTARRIIERWAKKREHDSCWYYPEVFRELGFLLDADADLSEPDMSRSRFRLGCAQFEDEKYGSPPKNGEGELGDPVRYAMGYIAGMYSSTFTDPDVNRRHYEEAVAYLKETCGEEMAAVARACRWRHRRYFPEAEKLPWE